jgi:hypothetical protein
MSWWIASFDDSVAANIEDYVVSEIWLHFWELPYANLFGLLEVAGKILYL